MEQEQFDKYLKQSVSALIHEIEKYKKQTEVSMMERNKDIYNRLISLESSGIPNGEFEQLKHLIGTLTYTIQKNTRMLADLLRFFNATESFLKATKDEDTNSGSSTTSS